MPKFEVVARLNLGVFMVYTNAHRATWTRATLRKENKCAATGKKLNKGERHYRPIGNQQYRYLRLSTQFVEGHKTLPARLNNYAKR